ncbi:myomesin-2-like [Scleropages formosus]|uniref:Myomesin-2-like n=1 Tax=Scleropages formosus TaxID=113540 RepID=A0A0P7VR16_SCLFO|nr:myomesin-2-like [Scleropages formosus]
MATAKVLPFYQRKHKHFGQDYRSTETKYVAREYLASSSSRKTSSKSVSQTTTAKAAEEEQTYTVPPFRQRLYFAHVNMHFRDEQVEERVSIQKKVYEELVKGPEFVVNLRSHTVWEKTPVKLLCTVLGHPTPSVKWFKDGIVIDRLNKPGKYQVESKYGVHSLTISRSDVGDSAEYTAVAANVHGAASSKASVLVKIPLLSDIRRSKLDITFIETFGVTFGVEGGTVSLTCKMIINPDLANLQPEAMWYRDDHLLRESHWAEMKCGGGEAKLTLPHLNKDDEGLYTLRMWTKAGTAEHSAYLFVKDASPPVAGASGAPMDIKVLQADRDYVLLSWKPPNITTESPITGYFVDRCEVGSDSWVQCNNSPVTLCKYPVHGLSEGHSYHFRVRAMNSAGSSRPSRVSEQVTAMDPTELERQQVIKVDGRKDVVIRQEDLEGHVKVPGVPGKVHASEVNKTFVVLSWTPPHARGREPLWYQIEKCVEGSTTWQRLNTPAPVKSPHYPLFDLEESKKYLFRVLSVNKHGSSDSSAPSALVHKQDPFGVPSAPGQVTATRNTRTSVFLQWEPPKSPNKLLGYYIDASVLGSKTWTTCNNRPYKHTRFVVHGLTPGETYVFRVQAVNVFGLSDESQESLPIFVEAATPSAPYGVSLLYCDGTSMILGWKRPKFCGGSKVTAYYVDQHEASEAQWCEVNVAPVQDRTVKIPCFALSGPCHDLSFCEVRNDSLLIQWKAPVYTGKSAVTGYFVEVSKKGSGQWSAVNEASVAHRYLKVSPLEKGETYEFRVRAANAHGVGKASAVSEPVCVKALPGTKEIHCGVDEDTGDVYLSFEACDILEISKFVWSRSYKEITDSTRVNVVQQGKRSRLIFKSPDKEDLGTYSVYVTETDGISASHVLKEEELQKMLELSYAIRHPVVPLKTELAYEVLEKGRVRFWLQTVKMSSGVSYRFIVNDKEVSSSEASPSGPALDKCLLGFKMSHSMDTGVIEMIMEHFTKESEGTYTVQIQDGKAKTQSSLVLIGDLFKTALKEADFQRKEYTRKLGPHFQEYLYFQVQEDCTVLLVCKLANVKKETTFHWFKDDEEIIPDVPPNVMSGSCALPIPMFSRKDQGVYKATLSDDKGKDISLLDISGKVFEDIINALAEIAGMDSKISSSEKMRIGGTSEMAWMQICEPTDREKGHYTIEIIDAKKSHTRSFDLSGQAYNDAYAEFQRLKAAAFAEKNRGRVVGGLPDVVTIMEKKTLSLTCTVWGDPTPEVTWFKNEQEVISDDHNVISFEGGKFASLTIKAVSSEDSGKYSINVRNKYGGEFVEVTVSVYRPGEEIPEPKLGQMPRAVAPPKASAPPAQAAKSPAPQPQPAPPQNVKSPTPSHGTKSPTPPHGAKSPTPPRSVKSPTPPRRK